MSFTPSITPVTETVTTAAGIDPSDLDTLAVQMTFHSTQGGLAYVYSAYAEASYSFADAIGIFSVTGAASVPVPTVSVGMLPRVAQVAAGTVAQDLSPAFGAVTTAGDLLAGWVFSNSGSPTFNTTISDPTWTLAIYGGGAYGWLSYWYKLPCGHAETAPAFSSPGQSTTLSQLLEFSGVRKLDQTGTAASGTGPDESVQASAPDTASGDLVTAITTWTGANPTPVTLSVQGLDSSGASLPLSTVTNEATTGQVPYAFSWGRQAPLRVPARTR